MWTETVEGRKYVESVSKQIVADVAPEELDLFDELLVEYFDNPTPPEEVQAGETPLGFGLSATLVAVTPAAAAMVSSVLTYILTEVIKSFQKETAEVVKKKIKEIFNPEDNSPSPLTKAQLEQINKIARKQAREFGMDADQARRMSNALIGSLTLAL